VTGLHRSGTSATARLLAEYAGLSLLDDPMWAVYHPAMGRAYQRDQNYMSELQAHDIVKCPRMGECLLDIIEHFPGIWIVYLVRDPRDVACSIVDAQRSFDESVKTMLENTRFGGYFDPLEGICLSYNFYYELALKVAQLKYPRIIFVAYAKLHASARDEIDKICSKLSVRPSVTFPAELASQQLGPLSDKPPGDHRIRGIGRWQSDLTTEQSRRILKQCGQWFETLSKLCQ
jgi:hypothetical protein